MVFVLTWTETFNPPWLMYFSFARKMYIMSRVKSKGFWFLFIEYFFEVLALIACYTRSCRRHSSSPAHRLGREARRGSRCAICKSALPYWPRYCSAACLLFPAPPAAHTHVTYGSQTTRTMNADRFVHIIHVFVLNPRYCRLFTHTLRGGYFNFNTGLSMPVCGRRNIPI